MRIRLAKESDLATAAQLWFDRIALLQESESFIALVPNAIHIWRGQAMNWIGDDDFGFFLAESDSGLAGILVVSAKDNPPWLLPTRRGEIVEMVMDLHRPYSGLSGALLERAGAWLKAQDIEYLEVQPSAYYPVEEAFWLARGAKLRSYRLWLRL
ncbi:MAG: hypothetical protein OXG78_12360 [Chloroflexi bacterium]|nr:hypothetical protein [Chloroflexota bacterium]